MKIETAVKKVVEFLQSNPASTKEEIGIKTKVKGIELTNVLKALRKQERLVEEGEGKELKLSVNAEPEETAAPSTELEIPVEDEQESPKSKGRNNDKFKFNGQEYGKGPLVREVVRHYIAEHPKVTSKQLKDVFPDELLRRFGIWQEISQAKSLSGARDRYFFQEQHQMKLGDKKVIVVCNQFTSDNVQPFLKAARAIGYKIK
jgi:hypothetical protein